MTTIADAGQRRHALLQQIIRRTHVDDFGGTGIADRANATHEQQAMLIDLELRIVDALVIILRPVEDDGTAFERHRVLRVRQVAAAEFVGDDRGFHNRAVEQVTLEIQEAGLRLHWCIIGLDDLAIFGEFAFAIFNQRAPIDGNRIAIDLALGNQLGNDCWHTTCPVIFLAEVLARWLHVDEQRNVVANALPIITGEFHPDMSGNGIEMDRRVG